MKRNEDYRLGIALRQCGTTGCVPVFQPPRRLVHVSVPLFFCSIRCLVLQPLCHLAFGACVEPTCRQNGWLKPRSLHVLFTPNLCLWVLQTVLDAFPFSCQLEVPPFWGSRTPGSPFRSVAFAASVSSHLAPLHPFRMTAKRNGIILPDSSVADGLHAPSFTIFTTFIPCTTC